jgi:hypothetical protein
MNFVYRREERGARIIPPAGDNSGKLIRAMRCNLAGGHDVPPGPTATTSVSDNSAVPAPGQSLGANDSRRVLPVPMSEVPQSRLGSRQLHSTRRTHRNPRPSSPSRQTPVFARRPASPGFKRMIRDPSAAKVPLECLALELGITARGGKPPEVGLLSGFSRTLDEIGRSAIPTHRVSRGKWHRSAGWRTSIIEMAGEPLSD